VVRCRNRTDITDNRTPVLSFIAAAKDLTIGGAGKQGIRAFPNVHGHPLHIATDMLGQTTNQDLPTFASILTHTDPGGHSLIAMGRRHDVIHLVRI
jgi:hypothetical protein